MKVSTSTATKIDVTDLDDLDPIHIYLEDLEAGKGKIVIECYGKSWSSYWGGMGTCTISEFVCSCDCDYIIGNLASSMPSSVPDTENISAHAISHVEELKKNGDITKDEAIELLDLCGELSNCDNTHQLDGEVMQSIYGDEWWYQIPERDNEDYTYLKRIVIAVQEALRTLN